MLQVEMTEEELEFMELFHDPTALVENLFPENIKAPHTWDEYECECVYLRPYQFMMQDYSYMIAQNDDLSKKENMRLKKGAGDVLNIACRNVGKTYLGLNINKCINILHASGDEACVASYDDKHVARIAQQITHIYQNHPFFKMYMLKGKDSGVTKKPLQILTKSGHLLQGVNEQIKGNSPGEDFYSLHYKKLSYDEAQMMTDAGTEKRIESTDLEGCVERFFGIPDLRIGSPMGKILKDPKNKRSICRFPMQIYQGWDEKTKEEKIAEYDGEGSLGYKLNVLAELIEGARGFWDIERLRKTALKPKLKVKTFEVTKENFENFRNHLVIERIPCDKVLIGADIGRSSSPSEIIILFDVGNKYKYVYNISLFKLIGKEQAEVFKWLYDKLDGAFIALDATGGLGDAIADELVIEHNIPTEHVIRVEMLKMLDVDFEKDGEGNILVDNKGKEIIKRKRTIDFAMERLESLLYESRVEVPYQEKWLKEFSGFVQLSTPSGLKYDSTTTDHLHQAWQCVSIAEWIAKYKDLIFSSENDICWGTT
jgi:hypothetical protein